MTNRNRKLCFFVVAITAATPFIVAEKLAAQSTRAFSGSWIWRSRPNKKKESTQFSLDIKQKTNRISGQIWFGMLVDGENDGSDSSSIPFIGTIKGNTAIIEFGPADIHSIEEEDHPRYKRPKSPGRATLRLINGKLEWMQTTRALDVSLFIPRSFTLRRNP